MMAAAAAHSSVVPCSRPSRALRAACGGGLRPPLTAAARGARNHTGRDEGRDEGTPRSSQTKKPSPFWPLA